MRGNSYQSRPVGSNEPPKFHRRNRLIVAKEVSIGNRPATTKLHHAAASGQWFEAKELYDNRPRKR